MAAEQHQHDQALHPTPVRSPVQTRQGVISGRVLLVLLVSLLSGVTALVASYYFVR